MRNYLTFAAQFYLQLPRLHRVSLLGLIPFTLLLVLLSLRAVSEATLVLPKLQDLPFQQDERTESGSFVDRPSYEYTIRKGDTLSSIFDRVRQPLTTMYQVLESDVSVLALDTLKPGDTLKFWVHPEDNSLQKLELEFSLAHQVVFSRVDEGGFEYEEILLDGDWRTETLAGDIKGSFFLSAKRAGLSAGDVQKISNLLKDKINFSKHLRAGDRFQVIRSRQYVTDTFTGESRIEGIRILNQRRELTAFLFDDNYFDKNGKSLARAFMRYPVKRRYRISSGFNPRRRHPVTRLIRPHNGTDFATPRGTPVYATGDGIVKRVVRHRYAGLYIAIQHGPKYKTRYLHLKKSYVRKGQAVSRGQKIALSGNSGRSTGPHLHYEFHINNRPVNAMKAPIPEAAAVAKKDRKNFNAQVELLLTQMKGV